MDTSRLRGELACAQEADSGFLGSERRARTFGPPWWEQGKLPGITWAPERDPMSLPFHPVLKGLQEMKINQKHVSSSL